MAHHRHLFSDARRRVNRFKQAVHSEPGAIDLASIMVGVLVIGVIAGIIAAMVFAVIPWSQNQAAKANLDAVKSAEAVSYTTGSEQGTARYADYDTLKSQDLIQDSTHLQVVTDDDGTCYVAAATSATGMTFYMTSKGPQISEDKATTSWCVALPDTPATPDGNTAAAYASSVTWSDDPVPTLNVNVAIKKPRQLAGSSLVPAPVQSEMTLSGEYTVNGSAGSTLISSYEWKSAIVSSSIKLPDGRTFSGSPSDCVISAQDNCASSKNEATLSTKTFTVNGAFDHADLDGFFIDTQVFDLGQAYPTGEALSQVYGGVYAVTLANGGTYSYTLEPAISEN